MKAKSKAKFFHKLRWRRVTQIMARDGSDCAICGLALDRHVKDPQSRDYITFDHIVPASRGGITALPNLRLAHRWCNQSRGNQPLMEEEEAA